MKFFALTALIATVTAADDWAICTSKSDCATAGSTCCSASQTGKAAAKICAPSSTIIVPNGIATYGGYDVSCTAAGGKVDAAQGANRLASGAGMILAAIYMLA